MTRREFDSLARELFGSVLEPLGFTADDSKSCVFHRQSGSEVFHFIAPDMGTRGVWYDVRVFPHSAAIDPLFHEKYPDSLGIPTDNVSLLSAHDGVNVTQDQFNCKYEENFRRVFLRDVKPLLINVAVPYLDQFRTVSDIIPVIRHPSFLGFALHHVGRTDEARKELERERQRLLRLDTTNPDVATLLREVERLLTAREAE